MPKASAKKAADAAFQTGACLVIKTHNPAIDKKLAALQKKHEENFMPEGVSSCKKGDKYFMAGVGVVHCSDKGELEVGGFKFQGTQFNKLHGSANVKKAIPDAKIKESGIRKLMGEKEIEKLVNFLKAGATSIDLDKRNPSIATTYINGAVKSWNPFVLADIVCKVYGPTAKKVQHGSYSHGDIGEKALEFLADEYAAVKKIKLDEAMRVLSRAAGKPSLDELSGYGKGTSPYDNFAPK